MSLNASQSADGVVVPGGKFLILAIWMGRVHGDRGGTLRYSVVGIGSQPGWRVLLTITLLALQLEGSLANIIIPVLLLLNNCTVQMLKLRARIPRHCLDGGSSLSTIDQTRHEY